MVIGITLNKKIKDYEDWVRKANASIKTKILSSSEPLNELDGVILTGGSDIHPKFYGQEASAGLEKTDEERDKFELAVVEHTRKHGIPVFGVCRGMQVFNVANLGTLNQHIGEDVHRFKKEDTDHVIDVVSGTVMHSIVGTIRGQVNSHHHQAVDKVGEGLRIAAKSEDGVVESLEWENPSKHPFLLLVQWHPERMNFESPFSKGLLDRFIREVQASKKLQVSS